MKKIVLTSSLSILLISSLPVAAQPPMARTAALAPAAIPALTKSALKQELRWTVAYKKPVRVGSLMTKQERKMFFRAMQTARTLEARQQIRELTYARLRQRAVERGLFVVMPKQTAQQVAVRTEAKPQVREVVREVMREPVRIAVKPAVVRMVAPAPVHNTAPAHPVRLPPPPKR